MSKDSRGGSVDEKGKEEPCVSPVRSSLPSRRGSEGCLLGDGTTAGMREKKVGWLKGPLTNKSWMFHPSGQMAGKRIDDSRKQSFWLLDSVQLLVLVGFSWS